MSAKGIAFIGLGHMGGGMAANQAKSQHGVRAFDLSKNAMDAAVVKGAEVVITMLPAGQHVRQVYETDVLPNVASGTLLIDCSTIDVESARAVAKMAEAKRITFADAPVSGGVMAADAGTLTFMVGCPEPVFEAVKKALEPMAKAVIYAGEAGAGQAAKICNNMVLGVTMLGVCEAFALGEKLGLDPARFFDIASQSSAQSWSLNTYCPWPNVGPSTPSDRNYEGGFLTALMLKDLKLAEDAAAKSGASTPMGAQAEAMFALFERQGYGGKDFSAVLQMLRGQMQTLD